MKQPYPTRPHFIFKAEEPVTKNKGDLMYMWDLVDKNLNLYGGERQQWETLITQAESYIREYHPYDVSELIRTNRVLQGWDSVGVVSAIVAEDRKALFFSDAVELVAYGRACYFDDLYYHAVTSEMTKRGRHRLGPHHELEAWVHHEIVDEWLADPTTVKRLLANFKGYRGWPPAFLTFVEVWHKNKLQLNPEP